MVRIVAAPLGALLLETFNVQGSLAVDILTAFLAIAMLAFIPISHQLREKDIDHGWIMTILNDMKAGFNYLINWKGLLAVIILAMFIKIALSPAISLLPLLVNQHFNGDASQYSLVEIAVGVGMIVGGLFLGMWGGFKKRIWTSLIGILGLGFSFMFISFLPESAFNSLIGLMFVAGLMVPLVDGPIIAIIQACVEDTYQGRVLTIMSSLLWITTPIGLGIAGPVSDKIGVSSWYLIAGGFCLIGVLTSMFFPTLLHIEDNNRHQISIKVDINNPDLEIGMSN